MRVSSLLVFPSLVLAALEVKTKSKTPEPYPILKSTQLTPVPYELNDGIQLECIQRQIDTGEHKFDSKENIIYDKFPTCFETNDPLSLKYGSNYKQNCSFILTDELYHLFQLYIHEDSPFSCRLNNYKLNGGLIPLTFNFRGNLEKSHLDIDTKLNILGLIDLEKGVIGSVASFSSGTNTKKYIIGDTITLELNVVWFDEANSENCGFDLTPKDPHVTFKIIGASIISAIITSILIIWLLYGKVNKKALKLRQTSEFGADKDD